MPGAPHRAAQRLALTPLDDDSPAPFLAGSDAGQGRADVVFDIVNCDWI
jgi:hypothetical protein